MKKFPYHQKIVNILPYGLSEKKSVQFSFQILFSFPNFIEIILSDDEKITEVLQNWKSLEQQILQQHQSPMKLVFRKRQILTLDDEISMTNELALHLLYSQVPSFFPK